jgi:multiple sugar transport system ATP-binding protein
MDEPLSNLNAHLRLRTRGEISALHCRLQTTFIYVTHDQVEAMTMGTRIAVMKEGVLQQIDTPQRLYDRPVNTFVATFIGSPAMNLIPGELVRVGEVLTHSSAAGTVPLPSVAHPVSADGAVVLGIRPEQFERTPAAKEAPGALTDTVTLVEPLGSDPFVTVDCNDKAVTARLNPDVQAAIGDALSLRPTLGAAHLFDSAAGCHLG